MNRFSVKLDNIEEIANDNARTIDVIKKTFWLVLGAVVVGAAGQYFM